MKENLIYSILIYLYNILNNIYYKRYDSIFMAFLVLYSVLIGPTIPRNIEKIFENPIFRLICISYILYKSKHNIQLSILLSFCFLITMHMINKRKVTQYKKNHPPQLLN
jgi:hypothetical protein